MYKSKYFIVILIILNIILGIVLSININKYNKQMELLSEDDKKYIANIEELKKQQQEIDKQINTNKNNLSNINKKIEEQSKIVNRTAKYIMKINISQTHFTLNLEEHSKDSLNDIDIYIEVSKEFYDKYNVGDKIADDFRVGSLIFKGSFGNWNVRVAEKKIV